jgi:hypothetical protein
MKPDPLKVGDKVRSKNALPHTKPGVIEELRVRGMSDCALVRYPGSHDAITVIRAHLIKVDE